jgi:hypothetical protein
VAHPPSRANLDKSGSRYTLSIAFSTVLRRPCRVTGVQPLRWRIASPLEITCWLVSIAAGLLLAWHHRGQMNPDGVSYLDIGDAYLRGDWKMALNAYWSPLYSWLVGVTLATVRPTPYWEYPLVNVVNLVGFLCALAAFSFFLRQLIRHQTAAAEHPSRSGLISFPAWAWILLGYALFFWASLFWISIARVGPDMLLAACVYLASALVLRIRLGHTSPAAYALLGAVLGLGYLVKLPMLPLAIFFLVAAAGCAPRPIWRWPRVLIAVLALLVFVGPFVVALSWAKGRLTLGDSGKLNYAWSVNGIEGSHWNGIPAGSGAPRHPTRRILDRLPVYEFDDPVGGTYPLWYDPAYWYEGLRLGFDWKNQLKQVLSPEQGGVYAQVLLVFNGSLLTGLLLLLNMSRRGRLVLRDLRAQWFLLVVPVAAAAMYGLNHVEPRYIASFAVVGWLAVLTIVWLPDEPHHRRMLRGVCSVVLAMFLVVVASSMFWASYWTARDLLSRWIAGSFEPWQEESWRVADGLGRMGVGPGTLVGLLETPLGPLGNSKQLYWARLARVRIVAEIYTTDAATYWASEEHVKRQVEEAFARARVAIMVTNRIPKWAFTHGWHPIGTTGYYMRFLPKV